MWEFVDYSLEKVWTSTDIRQKKCGVIAIIHQKKCKLTQNYSTNKSFDSDISVRIEVKANHRASRSGRYGCPASRQPHSFLQIIDEEGFIGIDIRQPDYLLIDVGIRNTVLFPASARSVTWSLPVMENAQRTAS